MEGAPLHNDPLALDGETMRALGYRTVDLLVEWLERESPPIRRATPGEMRERLHGPPPEQPEPFEEILAGLARDVLPFASRVGHPRFFGFVPFAGTWPGALGDLIASACNLYAGSWMESAGPSQVELEVLGWFKEWIGYPARGRRARSSAAARPRNLTALACARETPRRPDARRPRALRLRPGALVGRPRGADARLPARARCACCRSTRRSASTRQRSRAAMEADVAAAADARSSSSASGGRDEHRRGRPACRSSPRSAASTACGCTSTRAYGGFAVLTDRGARCRGSSWPTRSRSTRTSGSTSRSSAAACSCATGRRCGAAFEIAARLPPRRRGRRRGGQLLPTSACS